MSWLSPANTLKRAHSCSKTCCTDPIACHSQARRAHEHCARSTSRNSNWDHRLIRQLDATFLHVVQNCEQSRTFQSLTASAAPLQVLLCAISIKIHAGVTHIKLRQRRTAERFTYAASSNSVHFYAQCCPHVPSPCRRQRRHLCHRIVPAQNPQILVRSKQEKLSEAFG